MRRRLSGVTVALTALAGAAGCTSSSAVGASGGDSGVAAPATAVARVGLTDFAVAARPAAVTPGEVELAVTNAGATAHDLVVTGTAGEWRTPVLRPGERATLRVVARAGEQLELWCSVAGHDAAGMRGPLAVATAEPLG